MNPQTSLPARPGANRPHNPSIHPELTGALRAAVAEKAEAARTLLADAVAEFGAALTFANSLGAEDVVLTDLILTAALPVESFLLDTGRLPPETYTLLGELEARYRTRLTLYFPESDAVEAYVRAHGVDAFHQSVELRRACCRVRKLDPLRRALAGKKAWITGLRAAQSPTRDGLAQRENDGANGLVKFNPLADWSEAEVWAYIRIHDVPYNALHERFYPSIGCAPCTRAISLGEDIRAGRWWWEMPENRECGLHARHP
ncbi:MAG: phosphoadenylyl-sulfate reductase [Azoarcus sp.]|jgi:phosphoadenosine phosphosulfate reductase|nr:phosphoadenylyl-sulfate reductase [Azoarcus sp.]